MKINMMTLAILPFDAVLLERRIQKKAYDLYESREANPDESSAGLTGAFAYGQTGSGKTYTMAQVYPA